MEDKQEFILKHNLIQIEDFGDYYINDKGEIYSYKNGYKTRKGWKKLTPWIHNGYEYITFVSQGRKAKYSVHHLVAKYFVDGYLEELVVNHIDGDKLNNKANNLEWVTQRENVVKGYETSGLNQVRNYNYYKLKLPNGEVYEEIFKGFEAFKKWYEEQNFPKSPSAYYLRNKKKVNGFELIVIKK